MSKSFPIRIGLLCAALTGFAFPAMADPIGDITKVEISAFGTPPGEQRRDLAVGLPVVQDELLETVVNGGVSVIFADGSEFHLGSASVAALDKFIYDPAGASGTLQLGAGVFRFIGGAVEHDNLLVETGTAVIGIRGTDVVIINQPGQGTLVGLASGAVAVAGLASGSMVEARPGQIAVVDAQGEQVVLRDAPVKAEDLACWLTRDPYICKAGGTTGTSSAAAAPTGVDSFSGKDGAGPSPSGGTGGGGTGGGGTGGGGTGGGGTGGGSASAGGGSASASGGGGSASTGGGSASASGGGGGASAGGGGASAGGN
jgi:hypothetical protein